jgi:crotonobetainyl-CoA:carnitine CoA-transferase CaiB-like acyl-CoA transferase
LSVPPSAAPDSAAPDRAPPNGPLADLLVADFSRVLAGPYATMLLADMGATVVKIEQPDGGDDTRAWGPPWSGDLSTYFQAVNRNKQSVACDLRSEDDRRAAAELCNAADVVVENFRAGTMDRWGLGPEEVLARNPGAVYCSITGFGHGAGKDRPGYDFLLQAIGGLMSVTGERDGVPMKVGVAIVDVITGLHALSGILAALHHRDATGEGQWIEVNLLSSLLSALVNQVSSYLNTGTVPVAMGNTHPSIAPYEMVPAADRPLALAVGNDAQFRALCEEVGREQLGTDTRFSTNDVRVENRTALMAELTDALAAAPAAEWVDRLTARGVPCGPVNGIDEAVALAARLGLEPSVEMARPDGTVSHQARHPITFSTTPAGYRLAPPRWDEVMPATEIANILRARAARAPGNQQ